MANSKAHRRNSEEIPQPVRDKVLKGLTEREAQVIRLRFDVEGVPPPNITQVAKMLGLTRECVRQIEMKALKRFQKTRWDGEH